MELMHLLFKSDGEDKYKAILDQYFKYDEKIFIKNWLIIRNKINSSKRFKKISKKNKN